MFIQLLFFALSLILSLLFFLYGFNSLLPAERLPQVFSASFAGPVPGSAHRIDSITSPIMKNM